MKLYAYTLNGEKIGLDIKSWTNEELNNKEAFIFLEDNVTPPIEYTDITSIENWYNYCNSRNLAHIQIIDMSNTLGYNNLTTAEKTIVDTLEQYYKIYKTIVNIDNLNITTPPYDIQYSVNEVPYNLDYDVLGLHKKQTYVKGELLKVEYFCHYDSNTGTYSDLCIKEERSYLRLNGYLKSREMTISWYKSDNTVGATKNTVKFYNTFDAIIAGVTRRENIIEELKIVTIGLIQATLQIPFSNAETLGKTLLSAMNNQIQAYVKGDQQALVDGITNSDDLGFLDEVIPGTGSPGITIRQYILDAIYVDYTKVYTLADMSPFSFFS